MIFLNLFELQDGNFVLSDELVTKRQLTEILGVSRQTIQRWQRLGLPCTLFKNGRNGFSPKQVNQWLVENGYPCVELLQKWKGDKETDNG